MTTAIETQQNGRVRKTLASQLDRLDGILDGLADALNESVAAAVEKAVGNVITEILTNPAVTAHLRTPVNPTGLVNIATTDPTMPAAKRGLRFLGKVAGAVRAGWGHVRRAGSAVLRRAATLGDTALSYVTRRLFRGRILTYAAALVALAVLAFCTVPRLRVLLAAAGGGLGALVTRARASLRPAQLRGDLDTY